MSKLPLSLLIALRFSRGRQRSSLVSLISIISTLGIALGVAVLIISLSAMNGFERELSNRILSVVPHATITPDEQPYLTWKKDIEDLSTSPHIVGAAPYILFTSLLEQGTKLKAVQIRGIDPQQEQKISQLNHYIDAEVWQRFSVNHQQIILGKGVAEHLGVKAGDWLTILIPTNPDNQDDLEKLVQPKRIRLQVIGIFDMVGELGASFAIVPLADAQDYLSMGDSVTGISVKFDDVYQANTLIIQEGKQYYHGPEATISTWIQNFGHMYRDIQLVRTIMYIAMVLVIGVACFNIVSTLVMAVKDKSSDIAVLRTQGAKDSLLRTIFIWYGLLTGTLGSVLGVIIGIIASLNLTDIIRLIESISHYHFLQADIYFVDYLPSELHMTDVIIVLITALFLSLLASGYPAQRACRINPAQILSGQ